MEISVNRRGWRRDSLLKPIIEAHKSRESTLVLLSSKSKSNPKIDLFLFDIMVKAEEFLDQMGLHIVEPRNKKRVQVIIFRAVEGDEEKSRITTSIDNRLELKSPALSSLWSRRKKSCPQNLH